MKPHGFVRMFTVAVCLAAIGLAKAGDKATAKSGPSWQPTVMPQPEALASTGRNPYFILEPGYQYVYQGKERGNKVDLTVTVLNETKPVAGIETRVIEER